MDITYKVRGSDGNEYGPVTADQVEAWVREGRLSAQSELQRSDMAHWAAAGDFTEFKSVFPPMPPPVPPGAPGAGAAPPAPGRISPASKEDQIALIRSRANGRWFYWIAGLSVINSLISLGNGGTQFIAGLGITQILDVAGRGTRALALVLDVIVAGFFVMLGVFAQKRQTWAYLVGIVLYGLDALIFLLVSAWLPLTFHGYVLFWLIRGFQACRSISARV